MAMAGGGGKPGWRWKCSSSVSVLFFPGLTIQTTKGSQLPVLATKHVPPSALTGLADDSDEGSTLGQSLRLLLP